MEMVRTQICQIEKIQLTMLTIYLICFMLHETVILYYDFKL